MELTPYTRPPLELRWSGGDCDGLVVVIRRMTTGEYLSPLLNVPVVRLVAVALGGEAKAQEQLRELAQTLAGAVQSWNLPTEVTPDGVLRLDPLLIDEICRQWVNRTVGIGGPLERPSVDGEQFPVESLPMDVPSDPPPS